jgi:hypothetical protein
MLRRWLQRTLVSLAQDLTRIDAKRCLSSNTILQCSIHPCPQRCHQLYDHSKMQCHHILNSKCPVGHVLSWKCYSGKPATCTTCLLKKKADEKRQMKDFERQQKLDLQKQDHAAKMAGLDEEIRRVKEQAMEAQLSKDMKKALEQKKHDLENAKIRAAQQLESSRMPVNAESSPLRAKSSLPQRHMPSVSSPSPAAPAECSPESHLQDKPVLSPAKKKWDQQKEQENASNDAIDSLMTMTGLEEVKDQFLRIKAKIDTAVRQNITLSKERFGIVLLGNPGTGKFLRE